MPFSWLTAPQRAGSLCTGVRLSHQTVRSTRPGSVVLRGSPGRNTGPAAICWELALEPSGPSQFQPSLQPRSWEEGHSQDGVRLDFSLEGKPSEKRHSRRTCVPAEAATGHSPQPPRSSPSPGSWLPSSRKPSLASPTHMPFYTAHLGSRKLGAITALGRRPESKTQASLECRTGLPVPDHGFCSLLPSSFYERLSQSSLLFFFSLLVSPCPIPFFLPSPPHFLPSLQHCFTEDLRPLLPSAHLQTAGHSDRPEVCSLGCIAQRQPWVLWACLWAECRGRAASP